MSAALASSDVRGVATIARYSQIANVCASPEFRRIGNDTPVRFSHHANMDEEDDKNGGPNHLRAWMEFRGIKGNQLADLLGGNVTPGMVSDLANSKRALSAKWLRRLATALRTTPGLLLDHDPRELPSDIVEIWVEADSATRRRLVDVAKALVRTGTDG